MSFYSRRTRTSWAALVEFDTLVQCDLNEKPYFSFLRQFSVHSYDDFYRFAPLSTLFVRIFAVIRSKSIKTSPANFWSTQCKWAYTTIRDINRNGIWWHLICRSNRSILVGHDHFLSLTKVYQPCHGPIYFTAVIITGFLLCVCVCLWSKSCSTKTIFIHQHCCNQ